MEKKIVKTGLYSFVLSLLVGLLIFKDYQVFPEGDGISTIVHEGLMSYIFKLLRFSAIVSVLSIIIAALDSKALLVTNVHNKLSLLKLVCVAICVMIAAYWIVTGIYVN